MKSSVFIAKYLQKNGITHVFELIGGMITHLIDSINRESKIQIISCHHEQCAGFSAEGMARINGIPGIALATSGPGATNLLTAMGSCYFDSVPVLFITGQVNTHELKNQRKIRQLGFQETDIVSIAKPLCKYAVQVKKSQDLPSILKKSFEIALEGRQGPCLIDIPMDIQSDNIQDELAKIFLDEKIKTNNYQVNSDKKCKNNFDIHQQINLLRNDVLKAKKPLILAGGGCSAFKNRNSSREIIKKLKIPVVLSLLGVDLLSYDDKQRVGFIGSYGNRWANKVLGEADLLITLGSRLDIKQTGADLKSFCSNKKIWQLDIDDNELGVRVKSQNYIVTSLINFEQELRDFEFKLGSDFTKWNSRIEYLKLKYPSNKEYSPERDEINPILFLEKLSSYSNSPAIYATDVGQHQMWCAQSLILGINDRLITSGGMGAMGFGLPAAIGSYFGNTEKNIFLITGDGSFQLNLQELETIKRNNIPIKIILFNNNCHGMVRQFQESYFKGNNRSTVEGYSAPDFVKVAKAYGINSFDLNQFKNIDDLLNFLFSESGPILIQLPLSVKSKVYPKLAFGRKFGEMEPEIQPTKMEST